MSFDRGSNTFYLQNTTAHVMLPVEAFGLIFDYLPPKDFLLVQLVCKVWKNAAALCIENWKRCCRTLGMSTHNRFFVLSFGAQCSWRNAYYGCKRHLKQLNNYQEFTIINLTHKFVERPRELKFIAPHKFVSTLDCKVECWELGCIRPSFHPGVNKTWSIQKDKQERLVAINDTYVYLLTMAKPLRKLLMRTISSESGEALATHTTFFPTSHESQPLQFSPFRNEYTIKKCHCCECFIMCSHFLDTESHSTVLYLVYLYEGRMCCIPHNLMILNNKENHDSCACVIDKMDIISYSQNHNLEICEQHILLTQCSYSVAKFVANVSPKDPIPSYCLSHCSKYWSVCDSTSTIFIYELSTMALVKTVKTDVCVDFFIQTVQFSMLYALLCCCSQLNPINVCSKISN